MNNETYKKAGYSVMVQFERKHEIFGWVEGQFPTTDDAVSFHVNSLTSNKEVRNVKTIKL